MHGRRVHDRRREHDLSTLYVVRHGQASFFAADYDQLSALGEEQSRRLGSFWATRGLRWDAVFSGPRLRQTESARLVGEAYGRAGLDWPAVQVLPGLDEYQAEAVLKESLPRLVAEDAGLAKLHAAIGEASDRAEQLRRFQRVYEIVIRRWAHNQLPLAGVEPWSDFCQRVLAALETVMASAGSGARVAVFTSGGPSGVAVERALRTPLDSTLELAWMVRNAAYCEFLFNRERFTLSSFNSYPHLDDPALWTYR